MRPALGEAAGRPRASVTSGGVGGGYAKQAEEEDIASAPALLVSWPSLVGGHAGLAALNAVTAASAGLRAIHSRAPR